MPGPRLRTTYRPIPRGDGQLQLGTGEEAIILEDLPDAVLRAVRRIDGATPSAELAQMVARAGLPTRTLDDLLDALARAGALDPDTPMRHLDVPLAALDTLAEHGIDGGTAVDRMKSLADHVVGVVGRGNLVEAVIGGIRSAGAQARRADGRHAERYDAMVLVARDATDPGLSDAIRLRGRPVLPVVATSRGVAVGPWHDDEGPCATCLDLRRRDGDAAWPRVLAALLRPDRDGLPMAADADLAAAAVAGALVGQWVRRRVVGLPETPGLTCEVDAWRLGTTHRVWPVHPLCPGHAPHDAQRSLFAEALV